MEHTIFLLLRIALLQLFILSLHGKLRAQSEVIAEVRAALRAGSSRELVKNFNTTVDLNFEGEKSSYSRSQAEFVLRDFFKKYPPSDFQYIHQGASKGGLTYMIGKYTYDSGSFRVLLYIKKFGDRHMVDLLDFTRD